MKSFETGLPAQRANYEIKRTPDVALRTNHHLRRAPLISALDLMASSAGIRRSVEQNPSWLRVLYEMVGGLTEVGLSQDEAYALVVSHSGRGLYDLRQGLRVARDVTEPTLSSSWISAANTLVRGIGPRADEWFECVGLWGGQLASSFGASGSVEVVAEGDVESALLRDGPLAWEITRVATEIRVVGFSGSGKLLILAASGEICVVERVETLEVEV